MGSQAVRNLADDLSGSQRQPKEQSMTTTTSDSITTETEDRLAILELIGRLSLTIDAKEWDAMGQLFTDTVYHDRTSLTGGEPYTAPVAQFVEGWRQTLQNMDAVHHQITNHVISLDGDQATCAANMQDTCARQRVGRPHVDGRRPPRLPAHTDSRRLADRRSDLHPPMGDWQHECRDPRGCRGT